MTARYGGSAEQHSTEAKHGQLQAAQGPDPGGNASSGTSNEEDVAQAKDGGDWSEAQIAALQVNPGSKCDLSARCLKGQSCNVIAGDPLGGTATAWRPCTASRTLSGITSGLDAWGLHMVLREALHVMQRAYLLLMSGLIRAAERHPADCAEGVPHRRGPHGAEFLAQGGAACAWQNCRGVSEPHLGCPPHAHRAQKGQRRGG